MADLKQRGRLAPADTMRKSAHFLHAALQKVLFLSSHSEVYSAAQGISQFISKDPSLAELGKMNIGFPDPRGRALPQRSLRDLAEVGVKLRALSSAGQGLPE